MEIGSCHVSAHEQSAFSLVGTCSLTQHVRCPTRFRGSSEPCTLDLVSSDENFVNAVDILSPLGEGDHFVISIKCDFNIFNKNFGQQLNYSKGDYVSLCKYLKGSVKEPNKFHIYETEKITRKASDMAVYIELFGSFTRYRHARCI